MKSIRIYSYRWVVLGALMAVIMASEMQWLVLVPISRAASKFYVGQIDPSSFFGPDILTLIHLIAFVVVSIPISYIVTKLGVKWTLRSSAIILAFFSLLKGFGAQYFVVVVISQIGLSIAYSAIISNVTLVVSRWFPLRERGFATGLVSLAQYVGLLLVMIVSPRVVVTKAFLDSYGSGVAPLLLYLGIINAAASIAVLFLFKEKPPTPPSREPFKMQSFIVSYGLLLRKKHMGGFITIFGFVWALYNVFIVKIDTITAFVGIEDSTGSLGLVFLIGGIAGSVVIPILSDYFRRRKFYFRICLIGIILGMLLFAFIPVIKWNHLNPVVVGFIGAVVLGFFFQSAIPLGFQYASELSYPVQESSSQGVLLLSGHFLAVPLLVVMSLQGSYYLEHVFIASIALLIASLFGSIFIKESPIIVTEEERFQKALDQESIRPN
jgi:MFS family permease